MNYKINIINNFIEPKKVVDEKLGKEIELLLRNNFIDSNDGKYSEDDLEKLLSTKTSEIILKYLQDGLLVYFTNGTEEMIAVGMVVKKGERYEAKTLNVKKEYKGKGLGKSICNIREDILRNMGVKECFIESLKFDKTLAFHKSRGYKEAYTDKKLKFTVYMKKEL